MEDNKYDRLSGILEEFLFLYRFINRKAIYDSLKSELKNEQEIEIYQNSDGEKSTRELARILKNKCSHSTVSNCWNRWALIGLVVPTKQKGRFKAAFNLSEYGIIQVEITDIDKEN